jgi:putative acetyltransferase
MDLRFGPLLKDELPALLDLWVESWSHVYPGIRFDDRREWFDGHLASWLDAGGACRVARAADDRIVGFILIDPAKAHLDQICVAHDLKGGGCGLALMREAQRLSPRRIDLSVNASNHRAIRFYEREGFERVGEGINPNSGLPVFNYRWGPSPDAS